MNSKDEQLRPDRWKLRSATYPGLAEAMANQWSELDHAQLGLGI